MFWRGDASEGMDADTTVAASTLPSTTSYTSNNAVHNNESTSLRNFKEYFECPVCYTVPRRPPIFQCSEGHLICSECKPKVLHCPICRSGWSGRLRFAEMLLEKVPHSCRYAGSGCDLELLGPYIDGHEKDCPYGPVRCQNRDYGCRTTVLRRELKSHQENCGFNPIICQVEGCGIKTGPKAYLRHVQAYHSPVSPMVLYGPMVALLISLLVHLYFAI